MKPYTLKIVLLVASFVLMSSTNIMHDPLSASFTLNENENFWTMNISTSYTALDQALRKENSNIDFNKIDSKAYKQLAFEYVKKNISIVSNGKTIAILQSGGIKLGHHQTDLKIVVENIPKSLDKMEIRIPCFSINGNHISVLRINAIDADSQNKIVLNKGNSYSATFLNKVGVFVN